MGLRIVVLASIITGLSVTGAEAKRGFSFKGLGFGGSTKAAPTAAVMPKPAPALAAPKPATPPPQPAATTAAAPAATSAPVTQSRSILVISGPRQSSSETEEQRRRRNSQAADEQLLRPSDQVDNLVKPAGYRPDSIGGSRAEGTTAAPKGFTTLN